MTRGPRFKVDALDKSQHRVPALFALGHDEFLADCELGHAIPSRFQMGEQGLEGLRAGPQNAQLAETQSLREERNRELQSARVVVVQTADVTAVSDADSPNDGRGWRPIDCPRPFAGAALA